MLQRVILEEKKCKIKCYNFVLFPNFASFCFPDSPKDTRLSRKAQGMDDKIRHN